MEAEEQAKRKRLRKCASTLNNCLRMLCSYKRKCCRHARTVCEKVGEDKYLLRTFWANDLLPGTYRLS